MRMQTVDDVKLCTGCQACQLICSSKAINFDKDAEGFFHPVIDKKKCVLCGKCFEACPQIVDVKRHKIQEIYALRCKNGKELRQSASGGAFSVLAQKIIDSGGVVIGCTINDKMEVKHICAFDRDNLEYFHGSKYVQSNTDLVSLNVKEMLLEGRNVLFSGTPCQVAGLRQALNCDFPNLYTVDLMCHGVPSQLLFQKYIKWLEKNYSQTLEKYIFRYKDGPSWGLPYRSKAIFTNRTVILEASFDPYLNAFLSAKIFNKACYYCKYGNEDRCGDISIGDYWSNMGKSYLYDGKGVSFLSVNNPKGRQLFSQGYSGWEVFDTITNPDESDFKRLRKNGKGIPAIREEVYSRIEDTDLFETLLKTHPSAKCYFTRYMPVQLTQALKRIVARRNGI